MDQIEQLTLKARRFAWDGRGGLWVLSDEGTLRRLDMVSGRVEKRHMVVEHASTVEAMAASNDGERVVLCDPMGVRVLELPLACGDVIDLPFVEIASAAFSPDGEWLALAHETEGVLMLKGPMLELMWQACHEEPLSRARVRFSPGGDLLAMNAGSGVVCHDAETGEERYRVAMAHFALFDHAVDPSFEHWALAVEGGASLYTADAMEGDRFMYGHGVLPSPVSALTWLSDDEVWVGTRRGEVVQVEPRLRTALTHDAELLALEGSAVGRHLASLWSDGTVRVLWAPRLEDGA